MSENNVVSRYTTGARINHWITAISLILLALSGMPERITRANLFRRRFACRGSRPFDGGVHGDGR